jgi:transposase
MTSPDGPRLGGSRSGAGGILVSGRKRRARTWPGARIPTGRCRISRGGRACTARTWPAPVDLGVAASHQEVDIPEMAAMVIQHDLHAVACSCGRVHRAAAPTGAGTPGTVTYGIGLQAWCVYLMAAHVIPVHRCTELIEALTGAKPSPGFVHGLLARAAAAVKHTNQLIRALIITASVISADETPIRVGPGPRRARSTCW